MVNKPPDDAKHSYSWLSLRKRRCLCFLLGSTLVSVPVLFILHGSDGLNLHSITLNLSWSSSNQPFWPHESASTGDVVFPPENPIYTLFEPPSLSAQIIFSSLSKTVVRPVRSLGAACLDAYFESGQPCASAVPDPPLDVLWTWVNGSDRFLMESMSQAVRRNDPRMPTTSRPNTELFRDHDELLHSVRSVLKHFRQSTNQLHILTSDFPFNLPVVKDGDGDGDNLADIPRRLGLAPSWLNLTNALSWRDGDVNLSMVYHSQIIKDYQGLFNSYAIESQIQNMQGLSDNFVYMNDDFFMLTNLTKSDFYTSTYGTVLRMQVDLQVDSDANPKVNPPGGEWGPLKYTNWCLSNRFGTRPRPYMAHTAKSLSLPLMIEFESIWQSQIDVTATHPFRGMTTGNRDVYTIFLFTHTLVERWREALLWSWAIGKMGSLEGGWSVKERNQAWQILGGDVKTKTDIVVKSTYRSSAHPGEIQKNIDASGNSLSGKTTYQFVSGDGYPYGFIQARPKRTPYFPKFLSSPRPDKNGNSKGTELCKLSYSNCFDPKKSITTASDFFKFIAFERVECGDCVINALRAKSGESGLSAFLPPHEKTYRSVWDDEEDGDGDGDGDGTLGGIDVEAIARMDAGDYNKNDGNDDDVESRDTTTNAESTITNATRQAPFYSYSPTPHLPLISHYEEGDFSLAEVLPTRGKINVRAWTLQLLERYRFVVGDTPTRFNMITSLNDARNQMKSTDRDKNAALLCINDNIRGVTAAQADVFLRDWQGKRWSDRADWEKR